MSNVVEWLESDEGETWSFVRHHQRHGWGLTHGCIASMKPDHHHACCDDDGEKKWYPSHHAYEHRSENVSDYPFNFKEHELYSDLRYI